MFPFIYGGTEYSECTTVSNGGTPWCATSVNDENVMTAYGNCDIESCKN